MLMSASAFGADAKKPAPEPRIASLYPLGGQAGQTLETTVRGVNLSAARAVLFAASGFTAEIVEAKAEAEASLVRLRVSIPVNAVEGPQPFRLVTGSGVTNEATLRIGRAPALEGVIAEKGEMDSHCFQTQAGETYTFEVVSGFGGFDPQVSLWTRADSWFDPEREVRIAYNDEPLHFPGLDHDARLVHRFDKAGRYCAKISAFGGGGGPDFVYQLRMTRGETAMPKLHPIARPAWAERLFTRRVDPQWVAAMSVRGNAKATGEVEVYRAAADGSAMVPVMPPNGIVAGRLSRAADVHRIKVKIDKPQDLAIEIETPEATMPRFNPVVRLMQPDGFEVVTNVYTKRNNNGLYMMKMIQAKTTVTLRSAGEYLLEIRDITTDCWAPDFAYRVLVRPQIAHAGAVEIVEDRVNLEPGQSKPLTIRLEREEGFKGYVAIAVEGLPEGVTAVTGMENPVEKPPLPNAGRRERYVGIEQSSTVMLMASPEAKISQLPASARVTVRPVVEGRVGEVIASKRVPVMIVARRPS